MTISCLMAAELALYASCFVCGIVTAASLAITQGNLGGLCMLYGTVEYNNLTQTIKATGSSPVSLCYFVSAISVIVAVTCFTLSLYWLYSCCIDGTTQRASVCMILTQCVCGVFLFFLLISGCILKIGRDSLCSSIVKAVKNTSCEQAQEATWAAAFDGDQFYTRLHNAETAVWVNFFLWFIAGGLLAFQRCLGTRSTTVEGFGAGGGAGAGAGAGGGESAGETKPLVSDMHTGDFYD